MPLNNYSFSRTAIILSLAMMSSIVVAGINLIFLVSQISTCHSKGGFDKNFLDYNLKYTLTKVLFHPFASCFNLSFSSELILTALL